MKERDHKINPNAFPSVYQDRTRGGVVHTVVSEGMSLRDYIAVEAMKAIIGRQIEACSTGNNLLKWAEATRNPLKDLRRLSQDSFAVADAMLKERLAD